MNWEIFKLMLKYQRVRSYLFLTSWVMFIVAVMITGDDRIYMALTITSLMTIAITLPRLLATWATLNRADKRLKSDVRKLAHKSFTFWKYEWRSIRGNVFVKQQLLLLSVRFSLYFGADLHNLWMNLLRSGSQIIFQKEFTSATRMRDAALDTELGTDTGLAKRGLAYLLQFILYAPSKDPRIDESMQELMRIAVFLICRGIPFEQIHDQVMELQESIRDKDGKTRRTVCLSMSQATKDLKGVDFIGLRRTDNGREYFVVTDEI